MLTRTLLLLSCLTSCLAFTTNTFSAEYKLAIQPILPSEVLKQNFQPLADYLSEITGDTITITTQRNFLFYWTKMRKKKVGFDLVLDAAHLTDYRAKKLGYTVLAKMPDTVSFSIVTSSDNLIFDVDDLIGMSVSTLHSPSLGSVRLEALFPNPMRMPHYVWERNTTVAIENLLAGKVDAAIIPTRLVSDHDDLNLVLTTKPVPHMALSASPTVPTATTEKIRLALINATETEKGRAMLNKLKMENFEKADNKTYDGYANLLEQQYGFEASTDTQQKPATMKASIAN